MKEVSGANLGRLNREIPLTFIRGHPPGLERGLVPPLEHFIDFRLSDFPWGLCIGPLWIQNKFNYLLMPARQTLGGQEVRIYASPGE